MTHLTEPGKKELRQKGDTWTDKKGQLKKWDGKNWRIICVHNRRKQNCKSHIHSSAWLMRWNV